MGAERRKHVRVCPTADMPLVLTCGDGMISQSLQVMDVSLGGLALIVDDALMTRNVGDVMPIHWKTTGGGAVELPAVIRHKAATEGGICGVEFEDLSDSALNVLERYVTEMFERGN
ncbi:MAG: PilZ domain-containing protein [Polyangiaceae bacterium]|nr:PilZ domain-containing protein [Polyangiaceae bacterium]